MMSFTVGVSCPVAVFVLRIMVAGFDCFVTATQLGLVTLLKM